MINRPLTAFTITGLPLFLACLAISCSRDDHPHLAPTPPQPSPVAFDGEAAFSETRDFIALGPRVSGSAGAERAAAYIERRLNAIGVSAELREFETDTPRGTIRFRNVIGTLPGEGEGKIVIAGHYDTKSGISDKFVGANDSGSSTGLILALADQLRHDRFGPDILFAFFDGEECQVHYGPNDGLHGSRQLAENLSPDEVRAVIVVDMIGDRDLRVTIPRNSSPELITCAFDAAKTAGVRNHFALYEGAILDDHVPFLERGIPAIDLIDFHFGSAPGKNDFWHTDEDSLDKLSAESLEMVGRVIIHMIHTLSSAK